MNNIVIGVSCYMVNFVILAAPDENVYVTIDTYYLF